MNRFYRGLILTDLDHTMLGPGLESGRTGDIASFLWETGIPVVPVTAKTIREVVLIMNKIGLDNENFLAAVENGAVIYAAKGLLGSIDGNVTIEGLKLEFIKIAKPVMEWKHIILDLINNIDCEINILENLEEAKKIVNFDKKMIEAMIDRQYDMVLWSPKRECLETVAERAMQLGFNALLGSKFLHIYTHEGKGEAADYIINKIFRYVKRPIVALGDSPIDWPMLDIADLGIVMPRYHGISQGRLRAKYLVAQEPAPRGWEKIVEYLFLSLF